MENLELDVLQSIFDGSIQPRNVKLSALQSITENFSKDRIIGEGGFATVYKGVLRNGEMAVKRIKNSHTINEKLFHREVNSLLMAKHKNIVRFLGFCAHTEQKPHQPEGSSEYILYEDRERILCFEYINNGSLENYIADELRGLQWDTRYLIIKGICEGLQYLHTEKRIMHMDLKPANILIDNNMVAKITDFGLSRMVDNSQTKTKNLFFTPGYSAPEFIDSHTMSPSYDVYSLGVIIIQLVSGHRSIPDSNNVLRRWSHRWHRSGKETPFRYQQIAKLIEIGLLCQEKDPNKRPFISDIISVLNDLESTDSQINNTNESTVGKIIPCPDDDMLGIEPLMLRFPIELKTHISTSLKITNETNAYFAFIIQTTSLLSYCIQPNKHIVAPQSKCSVNITLQPLDRAPEDWQFTGGFVMRSTKVNENLISEDITEDIFNREEGKLVDEVNLMITYKAEVPPVDVSLGSLLITDTRNLHGPQESNVSQTKEESKISGSTSDEVIQFDPPELCFPLVPDKKVLSSIKIINMTEFYVSFHLSYPNKNTAYYSRKDSDSIIPPRSTKPLTLRRKEKEDQVKDMSFNEEILVWYAIVADDDIKACDLDWKDYSEWKNLPIFLTNASPCTSNELIQFDPPELSLPFLPNKDLLFSVNIVNNTDHCVGFDVFDLETNVRWFYITPEGGVMPPRSTQRLVVASTPQEEQYEGMQCQDKFFLWSSIVSEGAEASDFEDFVDYEGSKELPIVYKKASPCTSNELIQFDPPELSLPFMPNKKLLFSVNIVNNTDFCVGFDVFDLETNVCWFYIEPPGGVMAPRSTQRLLVKRIPQEKEYEDMQCKDKFLLWSSIVSEGVQPSDFEHHHVDYGGSKELPIVYKTTSLCTSGELIQFDPPQLSFPFLPNMIVSIVRLFKIINITDHSVGFKIWSASHKDNSAVYKYEPHTGILLPQSTQAIKVRRTLMKKETEDMQCKDKIFVWNGIVTEGVEVRDVAKYWDDEDKELPVVLTKITSSTLVELIKFEPPEVCFPFLPSKRLLTSFKIVNITDYHIGFNTHVEETNVALYITEPPCGVLPPWSTQELVVTRVAKEEAPELDGMQCKDKYFVSSCFVTEDVNARDLTSYMPETKRKELPIVFTEISSSELIQFDPPELCFPLLPNQRALSSAKIVNITDQYIGFRICATKSNSARYDANTLEGILPPQSAQVLLVTRVAQENELEDNHCKHKFLVWNGIVTEDVKASDVIAKMSEPKCTELPIVLTKTSLSISDELVQFHPPEQHFPFLPNKKVLSTIKIVNLTDYNVGFNTYTRPSSAAWYYIEPPTGILQPRSTQKLMVTREEKEDALKDKQFNDKYFVWTSVVSEGVKYSDLSDYIADQESKEFPIVLDKISSITSDELIQLDPAELCMPQWPNKKIKFIVNVVNTTDFYVAFNLYSIRRNAARDKKSWETGILPPRSTKRCIIHWTIDDGEPVEDYFVWNRVATERVERGDIVGYMVEEESKKLRFNINKVSPCPSNGLIHFDPPELSLPFVPNKPLVFSVNIVNNTDYCVGFNRYHPESNVGAYFIKPEGGVMPPRSTQRLVVQWLPEGYFIITRAGVVMAQHNKEREDMHCQDKFLLCTCLVSEGAEASDIHGYSKYEGSQELPIVHKKTNLCTSDELIKFDPPQLSFPFFPNKTVSMFCMFKIVNVTDHSVGFKIWYTSNSADYRTHVGKGILLPQSTQAIKVRRTPKNEEREDMQCKDMITVWTGIVTEGVEVSDLLTYNSRKKNKELPVVLTKPGGSSSS